MRQMCACKYDNGFRANNVHCGNGEMTGEMTGFVIFDVFIFNGMCFLNTKNAENGWEHQYFG